MEDNIMSLATIKPVSDLRDYNKVLRNCEAGEPVILTKNGRGLYVVMTIDKYDKLTLLQNTKQGQALNSVK